MSEFEHNGENGINFEDFKLLIGSVFNDKSIKESTTESFELIDNKKDGVINRAMLKDYLMKCGEIKMSSKQVEDLFDDIYFDDKGNLDYKKFIVETFDMFQ